MPFRQTLQAKKEAFKGAFTSKEAMVSYLEAPLQPGEPQDAETRRWTNIDLAPSPPQDRKWTKWTFLAFWTAHAAGAGSWVVGSSIIASGLDPLSAWLCLATSHILITFCIVLNGRASSRYHVGFPVFSRSSYGMWGSYIAIGMRAIVCIIWNGTNSFYGGKVISVGLSAIWPSYATMPNTLPASAGINTQDLLGFFIFMIMFTALSFVHSRDLHWFYVIKSIYVFACMHGVLIWFLVRAGGVSWTRLANNVPMSQTDYIWAVLRAFNSGLGAAASLSVNQGDMTRYADKPSAAIWTTLIGYPIASALPCLYGILVAACTNKLTGTAYWNWWDVLRYMLAQYPVEEGNHGARFAIFLVCFSMALAYMAVNLATNSLPFGSDLSAIFPRWMTIRRGQVLCTVLGIAIVPWKLLNSAQAFLTFLAGYGYWLAPIAGIMLADYFYFKRGNLRTADLFIGNESSRYWYYKGFNLRALLVTLISLIPCMPSFAAQIVPTLPMSYIGKNFFYISFTFTYCLSILLYAVTMYLFPDKSPKNTERSLRFEQMADDLDAEEADAIRNSEIEEGGSGSQTPIEDEKFDAELKGSQVNTHVLEVK